jgi:hypothetical protein
MTEPAESSSALGRMPSSSALAGSPRHPCLVARGVPRYSRSRIDSQGHVAARLSARRRAARPVGADGPARARPASPAAVSTSTAAASNPRDPDAPAGSAGPHLAMNHGLLKPTVDAQNCLIPDRRRRELKGWLVW